MESVAMAVEQPAPSFAWMDVDVERVRAVPGENGLTFEDINIGRYGVVPDHWPYIDDTPRGASAGGPATFGASYSLNDKADVWSENGAFLYEQAIRERWTSAADVPWSALTPLPVRTERALDQLYTRLSEQGFATQQVLGKWLERIAYGFIEIKSFLATQLFDNGRHCEVFRKRALANGGGLGIETPGIWNRALTDSLRFTELVIAMDIMQPAATLVLLEALAAAVTSEADATIYRLVSRDLRRHLAYGEGHLAYHLQVRPDRRSQIHMGLYRTESSFAHDLGEDRPLAEALVILLGGNDGEEAGWERLIDLQTRQVGAYFDALGRAGMPERRDIAYPGLHQPLAMMLSNTGGWRTFKPGR